MYVRLSGVVVNALAFGLRGPGFASHGPATILLGSDLGQVVYSHCLSSLLGSKKLEYKREGVFGLDRFNGLTD